MKRKIRRLIKKIVRLLIIVLAIFLIILIYNLIPKNYHKTYNINKIDITDEYTSKDKLHKFTFKTEDHEYLYYLNYKYSNNNIISDVYEDNTCIYFTIDKNNYNICNNEGYYKNLNDITSNKVTNYENISIYDNDYNYSYLIWNYNYFIGINKDTNTKISLFDKDIYNLNLAYNFKNYLVVFNEDVIVNNYYLIDYNKFTTKNITLEGKFYSNSYILGNYKNDMYIFDKTQEKEYKLDVLEGRLENSNYKILQNNKLVVVSKDTLVKDNPTFESSSNYYIDNNNLYYKMEDINIYLTDNVDKIVYEKDGNIFILKKDTLYLVNLESICKLLSYSEWSFNNKDIYIY